MFGLPTDFDCAIFAGRELAVLSYAAYSIFFSFEGEGDLSITLESAYEHDKGGRKSGRIDIPSIDTTLLSLIGRTVMSATIEGQRNLILTFDDGQTLKLIDDSPMYESYKISHQGGETIV